MKIRLSDYQIKNSNYDLEDEIKRFIAYMVNKYGKDWRDISESIINNESENFWTI
jgi:hypothetical protein